MKTIYLHRNKINNKVYIGQTIQVSLNHRWINGKGYKTCTYFYNAILKYGWDNFEHIILKQSENCTQDELNNKEKEYIDLYKANDSTYGYNITNGGSTISSNASEKAAEWMKEHPEFGQARASLMLEWQKTHPDEILKIRRENIKKATEARKKRVQCVETGEIFESASEAARKIPGTTQSKICMVCRGQRKTCGGYHWQYVKEDL